MDASDAVLGKVAESVSGVDGLFEDPFLVPVLEEGLEDGSSVRRRLRSPLIPSSDCFSPGICARGADCCPLIVCLHP